MSEYLHGYIVGAVVTVTKMFIILITGHYFGWWYFGAPPKQDAPKPDATSKNKPDKRPIPPMPERH